MNLNRLQTNRPRPTQYSAHGLYRIVVFWPKPIGLDTITMSKLGLAASGIYLTSWNDVIKLQSIGTFFKIKMGRWHGDEYRSYMGYISSQEDLTSQQHTCGWNQVPVSYSEGFPVPSVPLPPICACATMSGTAGICHSYSESFPQAHSSPPVMLCCAECWEFPPPPTPLAVLSVPLWLIYFPCLPYWRQYRMHNI